MDNSPYEPPRELPLPAPRAVGFRVRPLVAIGLIVVSLALTAGLVWVACVASVLFDIAVHGVE